MEQSLAEWEYVLDLADERERRGRRGDEQQFVAELRRSSRRGSVEGY